MKYWALLYHFYKTPFVEILRFLALGVLLYLTGIEFLNGLPYLHAHILAVYSIVFIMIEVFFHFKVGMLKPQDSYTLSALEIYVSSKTTSVIMHKLLKNKAVQFLLHKADIAKSDIQYLDIDKKQLDTYALEVAKSIQGTFVTPVDLLVSYLFITEPHTKLLFNKKLKFEELMYVLQWTLQVFPKEEHPEPLRAHFWGEGIGEALTSGWTLETKKYTKNYTQSALFKKPLTTGRKTEFQELVDALSKKESNNVLLVGDSGVGKDALVEALAHYSFIGNLSGIANHKRVYELLIGPLLAGATDKNQLETRLQEIINEISHAGNVILFIPEFQSLITSPSGLNIVGILMPYLQGGNLPLIATMNFSNYKEYLEQSPLRDVFEVIKLEEPDKHTAIQMLFDKSEEIEQKNNVYLTYRSIIASIEYANRYIPEKVLPGSAITLLEDTANSLSLSTEHGFDNTKKKVVLEEHIFKKIEEKTKVAIAKPNEQEKDFLLHLEDKIHERIIDQEEAVKVIGQALRRVRSGLAQTNKPISFLFLGPTGVGKTETAKALSDIYFGNPNSVIRLDMSEYQTQDGVKRLLGASPGEGSEKGELTDKVYEHPYSLILLDEFEKAHSQILDLFLQVLDDGRLTDNKGKTVSFVNNIIIATSNAGSEFIREELVKETIIDKAFQDQLLNLLQTQGLFKPELLNRFDAVVVFKPLGQAEVLAITKLLLKKVSQKLLEQDIEVTFDEKAIQKVATESFTQEFGARPIRRYIQDYVEDLLSQKILKNELARGSKITVSVDNNLQFTVNN